MIIRNTTPEEASRVNQLFSIAFELPAERGPADANNPRIRHWAAYDDATGEMMSTLAVSDYQVNFDGHSCAMGGIGGVATLPEYRRQGGVRRCFQAMLPELFRNGYDFSYLYPFSTAYYRQFGYESCVQAMQMSIDLTLLNPGPVSGYFRMAEPKNPMSEAIRSIDQLWEHRYNMAVQHRQEDYSWAENPDPIGKLEYTYICFSEDSTPNAYTTFRTIVQPDGRNLVCSRFVFLDRTGFGCLMQLFKSLASNHTFVKFSLPAHLSIEYLLPEWALGTARWSMQGHGMVRVLNVCSCLRKARYLGSGSICLQVQDDIIAENNACFQVRFADGKAAEIKRCQDAPDAALSVSAFSALICGTCRFADAAQWLSGVEIQNPNACFDQVFYPKPLMITDPF